MKNFFLKTGLTLLCLIIGLGSAWGENFTLSSADAVTQNGITVTFAKGSNSNGPAWYAAGLRLYTGNTVTISSSNDITAITFNWEKQGSKAFASATASPGSYNHPSAPGEGKWTGSAKSITFTISGSGQLQLNTFSVTAGSVTPKEKHTAHFSINGTIDENNDREVEEGSDIIFPTAPDAINGKNFVGWVTAEISGTQDNEPTIVSSAKMGERDVTYYAVYATQTAGGTEGYQNVTSLIEGKVYVFGAVKAAASATLAANTTIGAVAFNNTYNSKDGGTWGAAIELTPNTSGFIASSSYNHTSEEPLTKWLLESIDNGNYKFKNGSNYIYLGTTAGNTSGAQAGISTTGNVYLENVNSTCANAFLLHPSSSSSNVMLWNTSNGYRMYAPRTYSATMTPYVRFYEYTSGTTYSDYCTTVGDEPTPTKTLTSIEVTGTPAEFWKGDAFNHNGMTVTAHYDDESTENVTASAEFSTPDMSTAGEKTVTITYQDQTDTYTINVKTIANTQATAYTVAHAKELIDAGKDLSTEVYVAGKISQVDSYSSTYKSITYWISTDGTTSGQFEIYGGKGLENADFSSMDDVQVGAEVIVYGKLKKFNSTYELDSNNYLVSYSYTPPTTDFINTPAATVKVLDPISIKDYINGEYSSYEISTSIDGKTQKDYEFVCIYDQIRFCKGGTYVVDVTGTSGSDTQSGQVTFTVTPSGAELTSVTLGGTLTKTTYTVGETFDFSGLTLTANCSDGTSADITSEATWEADPTTLNEIGTVTVTVMGSYCGESAIDEYDVTVVAAPQQVTWDLTIDETATATVDEISWTSTAVSMIDTRANDKSTAANNYYPGTPDKNYTSTRFYSGSTLTITPANGITITSVEYNVANSNANYANAIAGEWTNASASKSADNSKVTITPTDGTKAISIVLTATTGATGVTVYYTGTPVVLTLDHITISGYTTTFTEGDTFNFGGTVTAHYDDESTKDVTDEATFSGYDMSTAGTQTVTVSYTENEVTKTATYDITVEENTLPTYTLVTDASTLAAGDVIVLGYKSSTTETQKASGAFDSKQTYLTAVDAIINNGILSCANANEITLGGSAGAWTLTASEGLITTSAAKAFTIDNGTANTWTISIDDDGDATIESTTEDYGTIQYNAGSPRFLNYTSNQSAIGIYRKASLTTITVSKYGSTTLSLDKDYTMPEGLTGKIITAKKHKENEGDGYYTLTYVTKYNAGDVVPAGEALVIQGEQGDYRAYKGTATGEVTSYPDNLLCAEYTEDASGKWLTSFNNGVDNYYYKLTTKNSANFGWYWGNNSGEPFLMTSKERAYLVIDKETASAVRGFTLAEGEEEDITTFIESLTNNELVGNGRIYNLQGQMMNKLQKGINIVNGKKVIR